MFLQIINMCVFISSVVVSYVHADFQAISSVSDRYMTLITPAKFTFRIWGLIYSASLACNALFFIDRYRDSKLTEVQILLAILNAMWVILWSRQYIILSWFVIIGMLVVLMFTINKMSFTDKLIKEYFCMYASWIAVASSIHTGVLMIYFGVIVPPIVYMLLIGMLAYVCYKINSTVYYIVTVWALIGVYLQPKNTNEHFKIFILGVVVILMIIYGYNFIKKKKQATE